jgi:aryl-alcohol dehydrogenase-like predicted oxidoreductase
MLSTSDSLGLTRFVTMQNHYNLVYREEEREMIPLCESEGVGLLPWSPLARGLLAGNRKTQTLRSREDDYGKKLYTQEADDRVVDCVAEVAKARGVPPAQVALAWLLGKSQVTAPIVGASKPHHLQDAVAAVGLKLTQEEIDKVESVYVPHPVLGHH